MAATIKSIKREIRNAEDYISRQQEWVKIGGWNGEYAKAEIERMSDKLIALRAALAEALSR